MILTSYGYNLFEGCYETKTSGAKRKTLTARSSIPVLLPCDPQAGGFPPACPIDAVSQAGNSVKGKVSASFVGMLEFRNAQTVLPLKDIPPRTHQTYLRIRIAIDTGCRGLSTSVIMTSCPTATVSYL